jgi:hypothetical protein
MRSRTLRFDNDRGDTLAAVLDLPPDGELDDAQRAGLVEIAERCPVHRMLHGHPEGVTRLADVPPPHLVPASLAAEGAST